VGSPAETVLVTGASGLIGRQVLGPLSARGFAVHAATRRPLAQDGRGVVWHKADLLDPVERAALIDTVVPTHLLHLAWVTEHGKFWEHQANTLWLEASKDLVRRFNRSGGRRVVVAGSCAEYDWADPSLRRGACVESVTPCVPSTAYGRAKLDLGKAIRDLSGSAASGRVFLLFGEGEAPGRLVPSLINNLLKGAPVELGPGDLERDMLDSRTVGAAFAALLASDVEGPVNIGSGRSVTVAEIARIVGTAFGRPDLICVGARPRRSGDPQRLVADIERLSAEVGFDPGFDIVRSLTRMVEQRRTAVGLP
jgi:nucleoside-diphosphate-sugar epimerase